MESAERVILSRDCPAIQIPSGDKELLPRGTSVRICQALGSCYTIVTERGGMFRLSETEADAIGKKPVKPEIGPPVKPRHLRILSGESCTTAMIRRYR